MRNVGGYEWNQLSMWDITPQNSISKFVPIGSTGETAHYILNQITKVSEDGNEWTVKKVESDTSVPKEILFWRETGYYMNNLYTEYQDGK